MKSITWIIEAAAEEGITVSQGQLRRLLIRNRIRLDRSGKEIMVDESLVLEAIRQEDEEKKIPKGFIPLSQLALELNMDRTSLRDFVRYHGLPYLVVRGRKSGSSGRIACVNDVATRMAIKRSKLAKERSRKHSAGLRSELTALTLELNEQSIPQNKAFVADLQQLFGITDLHALYHNIKAAKSMLERNGQ